MDFRRTTQTLCARCGATPQTRALRRGDLAVSKSIRWTQKGHGMYGVSRSGTIYYVVPALPRSRRVRLTWSLMRVTGRTSRSIGMSKTVGTGFLDTSQAMIAADRLEGRRRSRTASACR